MTGEPVGPLLRVVNLSVQVGAGPTLLENVCFQMAPGERLAVLGPSGAGKSILSHAIAGQLRPPLRVTSGDIQLARSQPDHGRLVFVIFQNPAAALNPCVRIREQLRRIASRAGRASGEPSINRALEQCGLSAATGNLFPFQMSGGMKQRAVFAAALLQRPALLIADEVTTGLDPQSRREFLRSLEAFLQESGAGLFLISHDLGLAAQICPQALVMNCGRVIAAGPWADLTRQHSAARELVSAALALSAPPC